MNRTLFLQDFAIKTVKDTHEFWKALVSKKTDTGELNWWVWSRLRVRIETEGHILPKSMWGGGSRAISIMIIRPWVHKFCGSAQLFNVFLPLKAFPSPLMFFSALFWGQECQKWTSVIFFFLLSTSTNTSITDSPFCCSAADAEAAVQSVSAPRPLCVKMRL